MSKRQDRNGVTAMELKGTTKRRRFMQAVGALAGITAGASTMSSLGGAQPTSQNGSSQTPRITAHRGYADIFPENTVAAIEGASQLKPDRIEIDIQPCADGEIIVFHDTSLDDLTDEDGRVANTSCETVTQAEVLDSGETVPSLTEILDAARPSIMMNIEFKDSGNYSWQEVAERTLDIASKYAGDFYVSSFETAALEAVREVDSTIPVAKVFGTDKEGNLEVARELDAEAVTPSRHLLDEDLVETAHEEGRDVNVYTIDSWQEAQHPRELGVDGLIADYPSVREFGTEQ